MRRSPGTSVQGSDKFEITRMLRRHLRGVMAIETQVYPRPWSPALYVTEMNDERNRYYIVAKLGREVAGYGGLICYGDEAHVTTIAVDPQHQRRHVGSRVLYELLEEAIDMGAHAVSLEVRVTNWGAQAMYQKFGFRPVGVRKNYYQEINEDALIMWTEDIRTAKYRRRLDALIDALPEGVRPEEKP